MTGTAGGDGTGNKCKKCGHKWEISQEHPHPMNPNPEIVDTEAKKCPKCESKDIDTTLFIWN